MKKAVSSYPIIVECSFHIGELYFMLPFLHTIAADRPIACLLFTSRKVYLQYRQDRLLRKAVQDATIATKCLFWALFPYTKSHNPVFIILRILDSIYRHFLHIEDRIVQLLRGSQYCLVQIGGGQLDKIAAQQNIDCTCVIKFPHTSGPSLFDLSKAKKRTYIRRGGPNDILLVLDPASVPYYQLTGIGNFLPIGYHSLSDRWMTLVRSLVTFDTDYALVFSYEARNDVLPLAKWEMLHATTYEAIRRVFPEILIVVKPHPNQDVAHLRHFARKQKWTGVTISIDNPMLLSAGARFAVGFLTSGIYNSLLFDVPSVNYFNAKEEYVRARGEYIQNYEKLGVPDVETEEGLMECLRRIHRGQLIPRFAELLKRVETINSFEEFEKHVSSLRDAK